MFLTRVFFKHVTQAELSKTVMECVNALKNSSRTDAKHLKSLYSLYSSLEQLNGQHQHGYAYVLEPQHLKGMVYHFPRNIAARQAAEEAESRRCPQGPPLLQKEYQLRQGVVHVPQGVEGEGKWSDWPWYKSFVVVSKWLDPGKRAIIKGLADDNGLEVVSVRKINIKK